MTKRYTDVFPHRKSDDATAYEIEFTPLAKAFAESRCGVAAVEEQMRKELDALDSDPLNIFFHTLTMAGVDFIATPRDGKIVVDTATYDETEPLDSGPFKGKRIEIPRPDTD